MTEVTRESLAAALYEDMRSGYRRDRDRPPVWAALLNPGTWKASHVDGIQHSQLRAEWLARADRILAALPSPAPEPPPRLPCAFCDSPDPSKWHRVTCVEAVEAVRAAQPAPDLNGMRDALRDLAYEASRYLTEDAPSDTRLQLSIEQTRSFLQARGSGGEP